MNELEDRYFEKNTDNPYKDGQNQPPPVQPEQESPNVQQEQETPNVQQEQTYYQYRQQGNPNNVPPTLNNYSYNWKGIRYDNMMIICILVAFYFLNSTAQALIMMMQIALGGGFEQLFSSINPNSPDTSDVMQIVADMMSNVPGGIGISLIIGEALAMLIFLTLRGKKLFTTDITYTYNKILPSDILTLFTVMLGAQFVFDLVSRFFNMILANVDMSTTSLMEETMTSLYNPSGYLYIVIFGPIMEEIIFRGAILRTLQKHGANYAIVLSSMFFGLFHVFLMQGIYAFAVGLILGYTAYYFSLKWAILLHILNNGIATLIGLLLPVWAQLITFGVLFVAAIFLLRANRNKITKQKTEGKPVIKEVYKIAFSSPIMIISVAAVVFIGIYLM